MKRYFVHFEYNLHDDVRLHNSTENVTIETEKSFNTANNIMKKLKESIEYTNPYIKNVKITQVYYLG